MNSHSRFSFHNVSIILRTVVASIILASIASSCSGKSDNAQSKAGELSILVSLAPQKALVDAITGDSIPVRVAIPSGANPESWEPRVSDFRYLSDVDLFFVTGQFPFENRLIRSVTDRNSVVDLSKGIDLLYGTHDLCDNPNHHHNNAADPHIWSSIANMKIMAQNISDALVEADPNFAAKYVVNLSKLIARLDSIDSSIGSRLSEFSDRSFLIWHPSLSYFARDYSLDQIPLGMENKDLSVNSLREKIDLGSDHNTHVIFVQADYDSRQVENVARQLGIDAVAINPLDENWENQFNIITNALCD